MRLCAGKASSRFSEIRPSWHIYNYLLNIDTFAKEVPSFNLKGQTHISTPIGGFMTFLLLTLSFFYAVIKTIHLVERANPVMSELKIPDNYSSTDKFFLAENNFKMAFAVEGYQDEENKNDPRYVKWFVRVVNTLDG